MEQSTIELIAIISLVNSAIIFWLYKSRLIDKWAIINPLPQVLPSYCVLCLGLWFSFIELLTFNPLECWVAFACAPLTQIAFNLIWQD